MTNSNKNSLSCPQASSIFLIHVYQMVRPLFDQVILSVFGHVSQCRHIPTCSEYAIAQIKTHGTIAGIALGGRRILACR